MVDLEITQSAAEKLYYDKFSFVDRRNIRRCDNIKLERKLVNHSSSRRVYLSILGVSSVDTYSVVTQYLAYEETPHVLLCYLAKYIINNYLV